MIIKREGERPVIKIAKPSISYPKEMGSFELATFASLKQPEWRFAEGLEIDLWYQGIKNIPESLKNL